MRYLNKVYNNGVELQLRLDKPLIVSSDKILFFRDNRIKADLQIVGSDLNSLDFLLIDNLGNSDIVNFDSFYDLFISNDIALIFGDHIYLSEIGICEILRSLCLGNIELDSVLLRLWNLGCNYNYRVSKGIINFYRNSSSELNSDFICFYKGNDDDIDRLLLKWTIINTRHTYQASYKLLDNLKLF